MRLPPREVCRFFLRGFFGQKLENPEFCVAFVNKTMFRIFVFHIFLSYFFRNCSKYHVFCLLFLMIFGVRCEAFVWKASTHEGFCMVDVSKVKQQEAASTVSQSDRQRLRSNATKETEDRSRIRMDVITPPHPPPPPPHRAGKKSRVGKNTEKPMRNATHIGSNKRNRRHQPHSHGRHHPPHPPPPQHRAERQMQV